MKLIDAIIILILFVMVSFVVYCSFIKKRENPCKGCPYCKSCDKSNCGKKKN